MIELGKEIQRDPFGLTIEVRASPLLVSHVRRKTVGETSLVNTHPFERGRWVFAHNGTVEDVAWLRAQTSRERLAEVRGETDSELLFAWLLTRLDDAGAAHTPASPDTDRVLGAAVRLKNDIAISTRPKAMPNNATQ